jgi:hypothetical protein
MNQAKYDVSCRILGEFVDDASRVRGDAKPPAGRSRAECVNDLVQRIASEMGVPQSRLTEVVEKVLAAVGPQIEERVRKELQAVQGGPAGGDNGSLAG